VLIILHLQAHGNCQRSGDRGGGEYDDDDDDDDGDGNYGRPLCSSEWSDEATIAVALPQAGGGASRRTATLTPLRDHTI